MGCLFGNKIKEAKQIVNVSSSSSKAREYFVDQIAKMQENKRINAIIGIDEEKHLAYSVTVKSAGMKMEAFYDIIFDSESLTSTNLVISIKSKLNPESLMKNLIKDIKSNL